MRNLRHLASSSWKWRGLGWLPAILSVDQQKIRQTGRRNWKRGQGSRTTQEERKGERVEQAKVVNLVQDDGIIVTVTRRSVTMRHIMRSGILGKVIKVSHGRREAIKDKERRRQCVAKMKCAN